MVMWQQDLCTALVDRGFQVIRMDNRDSGLSTWLRQYDGRRGRAYTLTDMATDVIAVLDAIGAPGALLMGGSLVRRSRRRPRSTTRSGSPASSSRPPCAAPSSGWLAPRSALSSRC